MRQGVDVGTAAAVALLAALKAGSEVDAQPSGGVALHLDLLGKAARVWWDHSRLQRRRWRLLGSGRRRRLLRYLYIGWEYWWDLRRSGGQRLLRTDRGLSLLWLQLGLLLRWRLLRRATSNELLVEHLELFHILLHFTLLGKACL